MVAQGGQSDKLGLSQAAPSVSHKEKEPGLLWQQLLPKDCFKLEEAELRLWGQLSHTWITRGFQVCLEEGRGGSGFAAMPGWPLGAQFIIPVWDCDIPCEPLTLPCCWWQPGVPTLETQDSSELAIQPPP